MPDKYRVTINGFWCRSETRDDPFQWDGKHDEVFLSVSRRVYDSGGALLEQQQGADSELMGDASLPNRIPVGSAPGGRGGILTGDRFPNNGTPWERGPDVNRRRVPPYLIWEGEIPDDQVVIITPTIWEWDPGPGTLEAWLDWQVDVDTKYGEKAKDTFGVLFPVARPFFGAISLGIQTVGSMKGLWGPLGTSARRPIGMQRDPDNPDGFRFSDQSIALTSKSAELLISDNSQAMGAGVVELVYEDDPYLRGKYSIFVQVEKTSGGAAPNIMYQYEWRWCDRCQGLYYGPGQKQSRCPAGDQHATFDESGSGNYYLPYNAPTNSVRQAGWRWCDRCQGLYWGAGVAESNCPAGGTHNPASISNSGNYSLPHNVPADDERQADWRYCPKCQGLFYNPGIAHSVCPGGNRHMPVGESKSFDYVVPHVSEMPSDPTV